MEDGEDKATSPRSQDITSLRRALVHPTEAARVFRLESAIEARLSRLVLDVAPGLDVTAWYVAAGDHHDVGGFIARAAHTPGMPGFLVFPQVGVGAHRLDLVIAARVAAPAAGTDYAVFAVEADGAEFHAHRVAEDLERQRVVRRTTGWPVLRFGGAEIMYATHRVGDVLEAQVKTACPDPGAEPGSPRDLIRAELKALVAKLTLLPALRHEYVHPAATEGLDRLRRLLSDLREADGRIV